MKPDEAARQALQKPSTIRRWCREGVLEAANVNGRWYISQQALDTLLSSAPETGSKSQSTSDCDELRRRLQALIDEKPSIADEPSSMRSIVNLDRGGR